MNPSNARSFLLRLVHEEVEKHRSPVRWDLSAIDEILLFEFIHPSVNTRDPAFRLFNLPATWGHAESALVDQSGGRTLLSVGRCLAGDELRRAVPRDATNDRSI
jgi:hypothetical protein